ncbi:MAG: hypothetical protein ACJ8F3_02880 [Xanthobacteraceae bacterium]
MTRGSKHSLAERIGGLALRLPQMSRMQAHLRARIEEQTFKERIMAREFDANYYLSVNPDIKASDVDPFRHFVETGWREGRNPNPRFNTKYYVSQNPDVAEAGINPFLHYLEQGRVEGRLASKEEEQFLKEEEVIRPRLDREYYLNANPEVRSSGLDPVRHYVRYGWQQGLNPTPDFSTMMYLLFNEDLLRSKINPFYHYILQGQGESRLGANLANLRNDYLWSRMPHRMQDITFPLHVEKAEALFVIMLPEHNTMSGGIYSFFSIAKAAYNMRHKHDYAVVLMTRPNRYELTYLRQSNFRNYEDVFRFEQLARCKWVKRLYLNIPEYAAPGFLASLSKEQREYLLSREHLYINILNQNYELMPEKEELEDLRGFTHELTQSVAHHAYFSQAHADQYDLPTFASRLHGPQRLRSDRPQ